MTSFRCLLVATGLLFAAACGNRETVARCEDDSTYRQAYSTQPLRVPDDLSVPDETDALRIPTGEFGVPGPERCLELSPGFGEELASSSSDGD